MNTRSFLFLFVVLLAACRKNNESNNPVPNMPRHLPTAISWNNGINATLTHNADSTLQHIAYTFMANTERSVFNWQSNTAKWLTEMYDDSSQRKNVFLYDDKGRIRQMRNINRTGNTATSYILEFSYDDNHRLVELLHITIDDTRSTVKANSEYHYNDQGVLTHVITRGNDLTVTHTIDNWSPLMSFTPALYVENTLLENYPIYNYALVWYLQGTGRLPAKVTRWVEDGITPKYEDKIEVNLFTVDNNYRINTQQTITTYPGMPGRKDDITATYHY